MKRKFVTNLALLLFLNVLVKTFWMYGIDRKIQNTVGSAEYGLYFSLLSLSILLNIILDIGITNFNNREIARDHDKLNENLSGIIPLKFILSIIYAIIVLGVGFAMGYSARQFSILGVMILNQFLLSFILYMRSNLGGLHLFRTDALVSVADRFFVIIICSLLLWGNLTESEFRIEWLVYAQTAGYLLTALIALFIILGKSGKFSLNFNIANALSILKKSYPFAILVLLMSFFNRFDSVLLERMLEDGKIQAGIYAQSFRILDSVNMFAFLIAGMLLPIFSRMIKLNDHPGEMLKLSYSIVFVPSIVLAASAWFYNQEIISLLYLENLELSSGVFKILMNGFVFISCSYVFGTLLTANRSLRVLNTLAAVTVILNITLNFVLIPEYQAKGAAIASISSQGFYALTQVIAVKLILKIRINYSFLMRLLVFIVVIFVIAGFSTQWFENWLTGFAMVVLSGLVFAGILKILTPGNIYRIIRYDI